MVADGCRFRFPRLIVTPRMQNQAAAETRDCFQVQKHTHIVSHNPVATTELPCNQCLEVCPGTKGSIIYSVAYVSKVDGVRDTDVQVRDLRIPALPPSEPPTYHPPACRRPSSSRSRP